MTRTDTYKNTDFAFLLKKYIYMCLNKRICFLYLCFVFKFSFAQIPNPVACYNFSGNLKEASGGTPFTVLNGPKAPGATPLGTYTTGAAICGVDTFWNWVCDQGLDLSIGTVFPKNNYTIEVLFEFDGITCGSSTWSRIINFKDANDDNGLYVYHSGTSYNMQMYLENTPPGQANQTGTTNTAAPNTWFRLFVTRNGTTNLMTVYINNVPQISFTDLFSGYSEGIFTSDLILFKDDIDAANEEDGGTVDYVRIYNQPLTQAQITQIIASSTSTKIGITGNLTIACNGNSTTLTDTSKATNYLWSTGETTSSITVSPTTTTSYYLTAWNYLFCTKSCEEYDTVTVNVSKPNIIISGTSPICKGVADTLTISGGTTYLWSNGSTKSSIVVSPTTNATYSVAASSNGCPTIDDSITVDVNPLPTITVTPDNPSICVGTSIGLTASGAVNYSWVPATGLTCTNCANPTAAPAGTTPYTITGTDANGCSSTTTETVNIMSNPPVISLITSPTTICEGTSVSLQAFATGITSPFTWEPGGMTGASISVTPKVTTTYTVTAPSNCGIATDTVTVTVNNLPVPAFLADVTSGCTPLCIQFRDLSSVSSANITQWAWDFGNGDSSHAQNPAYCYLTGGVYSVGLTVTVTADGCNATLNKINVIKVFNSPTAAFSYSPNSATIISPTIQFADQSVDPSEIVQWWWVFGDQTDSVNTQQNPAHTYQDTGTYCAKLVVTDINGCADTAINCLVIDPLFTLYIPDAFSPNGDGMNDVFMAKGQYVRSFEMYIFDRWGQEVFHTVDINEGWNGTIKGGLKVSQQDMYVYKILATDYKNKQHSYIGNITLIR